MDSAATSGVQRLARWDWVIVMPYSDRAIEKNVSDVEMRVDILSRLRAAKLEVTMRVNDAKTDMLLLIGAPLERLEREADHARLRKPLRNAGGYVPFSRSKRHYFGGKVLSEDFFTPAERQVLIARIMASNYGFSGAFLNDTLLLGTLTGAHLRDLPAKQLLQMLRDRHPKNMPPSAEKLGADELAEALLESLACETRVRAILPLHASDWQAGALALAVLAVREDVGPCAASAWLMAVLARLDPSKSRAPGRKRSSVHSVLQRQDKTPRAAEDLPYQTDPIDFLREYCGEGAASMFAWNGDMCQQLLPLAVVSLLLYLSRFIPNSVHVQFATIGVLSMCWFQKMVQAWRRSLAAMEYRWGMEERDKDSEELSLQQAKAFDEGHARRLALSNQNVEERMVTRTTRAALQLVGLALLCVFCVVAHGITIAFKWVATGDSGVIAPATVVAFAVLDVGRIWGMQAFGEKALHFMEQWDDDIIQVEDRQNWLLAKSFIFDLVNHLCGLFIGVGHKAFSAGTDWVIAPPPCFSIGCRSDFEVQVWAIVGLKLMLTPLLMSLWEGVKHARTRSPRRSGWPWSAGAAGRHSGVSSQSGDGVGGADIVGRGASNFGKSGQQNGGSMEGSTRRKEARRARPETWGSGSGSTLLSRRERGDAQAGVLEQLQLQPFSLRRWQHRRQLDLLVLFSLLTCCATLAPLLPFVVCLFLALKVRVEAYELVTWTQRAPADRNWGIGFCTTAMSWIAALAVLCNSVTIMFVTTDIEEVIQILGKTYRYYIMRNSEFRNIALGHEDTNCVAGMCVSIDSQRAQGALYWFIWVCFVGLGWASRVAAARAWRTESYALRRARQRGTTIQREMGFYGVDRHSDMATVVLEEYLTRYNALSGEEVFERPPESHH